MKYITTHANNDKYITTLTLEEEENNIQIIL